MFVFVIFSLSSDLFYWKRSINVKRECLSDFRPCQCQMKRNILYLNQNPFKLSSGLGSLVTRPWVRTRVRAMTQHQPSEGHPSALNTIYCLEIKTRHAPRAGRMEQLFNWKSCNELFFTTLFPARSPVRSPVHWPQKLSFIQSLVSIETI